VTTRKHRNEILVGSFLCLGVCLFLLLLFLMGTFDPFFGRSAAVEADFEDVLGLQEGDPVFLFGMKVGKVATIRLLPPGTGKRATIRVNFTMPARYRPYLREDSLVKIDKTLTGNISMVIKESGGAILPPGGRLRGVETTDLGAITERLKEVLGVGEEVLLSLSRMVHDVEADGDLAAALGDFAAVAREVRTDLGPLQEKIARAFDLLLEVVEENRPDLRRTLANVKETSTLVLALSEKVQPAAERLGEAIAELERVGREAAATIAANRPQIDMILEDLRETTTNAANLSAEIRRRPWRLLHRPGRSEEKAMDLYDAAWAYNLGATELNRSVRVLAGCIQSDPRGESEREKYQLACEQLRQSLERQREAEEAFWVKLRSEE
jgi:ABC-type transporter Mla subunit MlaD